MQAITMAIGKNGINYFADKYVKEQALDLLKKFQPADQTISIDDIITSQSVVEPNIPPGAVRIFLYTNIIFALEEGSVESFSPIYQGITQLNEGDPQGNWFQIGLFNSNFRVNYSWKESYHYKIIDWNGQCLINNDFSDSYNYWLDVSSFSVKLIVEFVHNQEKNTYDIKIAQTPNITPQITSQHIPGKSIINGQESYGCFQSKVSDATATSIKNINFSSSLNTLFTGLLNSIPASGQLTDNILFEFDLGDDGLAFPKADGITIGSTGTVKYKDQIYNGPKPPRLPIPPVPANTDEHHANIYVSDYEINALQWAYFLDGRLNVNVQPSDLPDPDLLKTDHYAYSIKSLKRYGKRSIYATIQPKNAPTTSFQQVYGFTAANMETLQKVLPEEVYSNINGFDGDWYTSQKFLEKDLADNLISEKYFSQIESITEMRGMVNNHDLHFILAIQYQPNNKPNIIFDVKRTDVLINLALGAKGQVQTMQFAFHHTDYSATFISTTVPGFEEKYFGEMIWPNVGEPAYAQAMTDLGKQGVPIPIMKDFSFLYEEAQLSIQDSYIAIQTQIQYKN